MIDVRFHGVRGSIPSPGPDTVEFGGNTPCVEVRSATTRLALDAGTGLRGLGDALLAAGDRSLTLLLSHVHWDHIQGLPFYAPIYVPGTELRVIAGHNGVPLADTLRRQMSAPVFPVDLGALPSRLVLDEIRDRQTMAVGDLTVTAARLNHPDAVYAYRVEHEGAAVVYATDTEHYSCVDGRLRALAEGADVLVYDAQYLPEEYAGEKGPSRIGWGHSTYEAGVALAEAAGVGRLVLFHHDPRRTDAQVREIEARAQARFPRTVAAREGLVLTAAARKAA